MKINIKVFIAHFFKIILMCAWINGYSQNFEISFGTEINLNDVVSGSARKGKPVKWNNVNTVEDTWSKKRDLLICTGHPLGVIRSEKQYENFILHVEWKHIEPGGNSGMFVWSNAIPIENRPWPSGVEVQMLELDWIHLNKQDGISRPEAFVHGELFGVGSVTITPDNPRGTRSKSVENRCHGKGIWNTYIVVCVDGVIKLSVYGKFVNGISQSSQ